MPTLFTDQYSSSDKEPHKNPEINNPVEIGDDLLAGLDLFGPIVEESDAEILAAFDPPAAVR